MKMKQVWTFKILLIGSLQSFANDGGVFGIRVRGINPENSQTKITAQEGTTISVQGSEAAYLAARFPHTINVSPAVELSYKSLVLQSRAWTLNFGCQVGVPPEPGNDEMSGPVRFLNEPTCQITLFRNFESGDFTDFEGMSLSYGLRFKPLYRFHGINLVSTFDESRPVVAQRGTRIAAYGNHIDKLKSILPADEGGGVEPKITLLGRNAQVVIGCLKEKVTRLNSIGPETECFVEIQ